MLSGIKCGIKKKKKKNSGFGFMEKKSCLFFIGGKILKR